jgi:hypothetical protein
MVQIDNKLCPDYFEEGIAIPSSVLGSGAKECHGLMVIAQFNGVGGKDLQVVGIIRKVGVCL